MAIFKKQQGKYTNICGNLLTEPDHQKLRLYVFCVEKQKVDLLAYHLEGLRVPVVIRVLQFGNHWYNECISGLLCQWFSVCLSPW